MTALVTALTELRTRLRCQNCPATYSGEIPDHAMSLAAQGRALGWTVWSGTTIGGRDETRTFCPRCAGRTPEPDEDEDEPGWDAVCETCDARATEDWEDEVPLSEEGVDAWKVDHRCEPDVRLIRPEDVLRRM